jgi:hypothetical protein
MSTTPQALRGTVLVFGPNELELVHVGLGTLELRPRDPATADALRALSVGPLRTDSSAVCVLTVALDDRAAAFLSLRHAGTPGERWPQPRPAG